MKKRLIGIFVSLTLGLFADMLGVTISHLQAQQRYPWNGKMDVSFDLQLPTPQDEGVVVLKATDVGRSRILNVAQEHVSCATANAADVRGLRLQSGSHTITWDSFLDEPNYVSENVQFTLEASVICRPDEFLVLDLEKAGSEAMMRLSANTDPTSFNTREYKTTKLVLRKIKGGCAYVSEHRFANRAPVITNPYGERRIRLTKDYYLGLFELTIAQYNAFASASIVSGWDRNNATSELSPVNTFVDPMRGVPLNTFLTNALVVLNTKYGELLHFDLPTEAQWEVACRAGCMSLYYWGDSADDLDGRVLWRGGQIAHTCTADVGLRPPNPWGFYDILGNAAEYCRDYAFTQGFPVSSVDPLNLVVDNQRKVRGGSIASNGGDANRAEVRCAGVYVSMDNLFQHGYRIFAEELDE